MSLDIRPEAWKRLKEGRGWAQFVIFYVDKEADAPDMTKWKRDAFAGWVHVDKPNRHRHHG